MQVHGFIRLTALALGITGALAMGDARASGFQLKENSVKSLGSAFSGGAVSEGDTSVVVNNPAQMTGFEGTTVKADVSVISVDTEFTGSGRDVLGQPLTGGNGGNAGGVTPVPALSVVHKFDNGVALGAMVSAPFGLKTEYEDGWVGRYYAHTSDARIVDLTFSGAIDIIPERLSVGLGLIYSRAEVQLSRSVDFGTALFANPATRPLPFARPQAADGFIDVQGADNGIGFIFGITARPTDRLSIGLSHRSEIDYELRGTADWTVPATVRSVFNANPVTAARFNDGGVSADLTTPSITTASVSYDVSDALKLQATYSETGWSSLREVRIRFDNPDPNAVEVFDWKDTAFMAIGGEYKLNPAWTLRAGLAFDETPTSIVHRTPRLPDEDRQWYSMGASWQFSDALRFDVGYTLIKPRTPRIDIRTPVAEGGQSLSGEYDSTVHIVGVAAQYAF